MENNDDFTYEDITQNRVNKPVEDPGDEYTILNRGSDRLWHSLLDTAKTRPLTLEEQDQLRMLLNAKQPTKEFAKFVFSQGREA